jgi:hypothetical protein
MDAWRIPGVASFAFCLFFSKLIAYTFLYWLPYYIKSTRIEGRHLSSKEAGDLSVSRARGSQRGARSAAGAGAGQLACTGGWRSLPGAGADCGAAPAAAAGAV